MRSPVAAAMVQTQPPIECPAATTSVRSRWVSHSLRSAAISRQSASALFGGACEAPCPRMSMAKTRQSSGSRWTTGSQVRAWKPVAWIRTAVRAGSPEAGHSQTRRA